MKKIDVSFIIPAFNEEHFIGLCLESIGRACENADISYETIVVDNYSLDNTYQIAQQTATITIRESIKVIGELRNLGVSHSSGEILAFIDGDVVLSDNWGAEFLKLKSRILAEKLITGSHCLPPNGGILNKYWFSSFGHDGRNTHLGTGHLIVSARNFRDLGGFSRELSTGEDYDFCLRARGAGYQILDAEPLRAIHYGFPVGWIAFIRREWWHGSGDKEKLFASKVAVAAMVFIGLHMLAVASILFSPLLSLIFFTLIVGLVFSFSLFKFHRGGAVVVAVNTFVAYFYFIGRSLSILFPRLN